jgi:uncharacterized repeat protein (TIGR02543 family)
MKNKHFKGTSLLVIVLLLFVWVVPVDAEPDTPPPLEETNLEGAPLIIIPMENEVLNNETPPFVLNNTLPSITVWHENSLQFGNIGNPQERIDIVGNATDPDGSVRSLTYRLNGGSEISLSLGPDGRRLERLGDFNAAIPTSSLRNGSNTVVLTATDNSGGVRTKTVTFNYTSGRTWPMPYNIRWGSAGSIHNVAQVVDGLWTLSSNGVRPSSNQFGYDRLIAVGDVSWTDYEVLVPITIHAFHPDPNNPSDRGGVGIITRWQGHIGSNQPPDGWTRLGAYGYYSNRVGALALRLDATSPYTQSFNFQYNRTYMFKLRAETVSQGGRYSLKVWEQGKPEPAWNNSDFSNIVNRVDSNNDLLQGSVLLVAHRAEATFGDVTICPLNATYPLSINRVGNGSIQNQPAKSNYLCGEGVTLTATPDPGWVFSGWTGDINSTANPLSFNMTRAHNITANFRQSQTQPLPYNIFLPMISR